MLFFTSFTSCVYSSVWSVARYQIYACVIFLYNTPDPLLDVVVGRFEQNRGGGSSTVNALSNIDQRHRKRLYQDRTVDRRLRYSAR